MTYLSDIVTLIAVSALCAFVAGHRGRPLFVGVVAALSLGIGGDLLAGSAGLLAGCAVAFVGLLLLPSLNEEDANGIPATTDGKRETEHACPSCGRIIAVSTRTCPRCMNKLSPLRQAEESGG